MCWICIGDWCLCEGGDGDAGEFFDEVGADLIGGASDFEWERRLVVLGGGEIGFEEIGELIEE